MNFDMKNFRIESAIIAAGLLLAGIFIYMGFCTFADRDRSVQVKGFSERIVEADKVTWPIRYKSIGEDLSALYAEQNNAKTKIIAFLTRNGIPQKDITVSAPNVTDYATQDYKPENIHARFSIDITITISTAKVKLVRQLSYRMNELLKMGVTINNNNAYDNTITYSFNSLDKIKPAMIEASTKNAREAAEKFAKDSGSKLGKIKSATQGYFSIDDRDQFTPWKKVVRVVTSVDYYLKN
jgi:hypothetical protein